MKDMGLIRAIIETSKADKLRRPEREALRNKRLTELLSYVREKSPFYREYWKDVPLDAPLSSYPVTDKMMMMENFDKWMTDPSVTLLGVKEFMKNKGNIGKLYLGKYLVYTTSGSTGNPCIVLYDKTSLNVNSAIGILRSFAKKEDMRNFRKQGGRTMALFADDGFYLATESVHYNQMKMPRKKKQMMTLDVRSPINEVVSALNKFQPSMLGSYPTFLELLAKEAEDGRLSIHPAVIMTGGEHLDDSIRDRLERNFGSSVETNYSCTEGGTVACECTHHHFHINDDWTILEAVDENNAPVPFGTESAKVLLTNLSNKVCPFIRYEITDRIVMHSEKCPCGNDRPWLTLEGRTDDILRFPGGVEVSPLELYAEMKEISEIRRFQLIQTGGVSMELRIDADAPQSAFLRAEKVLSDYLEKRGVAAQITLSREKPQANPVSGKFRHVISDKRN